MRKLLLLLSAVFFTACLAAQDTATFRFNFNHMALSVKDVDQSAAFYKTALKLDEITNRSKLEGVRWFSLGEGKELHLIAIIKEPVTINKAVHLALTTNRFDDFIKNLDRLHIAYSDWPGAAQKVNTRADGVKQIFFRDPDGYWIEVNSVGQQ